MAERLRAAPMTVPALVAAALFLVWIPFDGGQPITAWAPGALLLLALLAACVIGLPPRWRELPVAVRVATALLAGFTAWSYLSIAWADDQGVALEGADRTLLYLVAFALLALWPQRPASAAWVLGLWTAGVAVLATVTLVRVGALDDARALFNVDRLAWPANYANAAAATWLMALWPAILLAASPRVPWALRGVLAAAGVVLADVAMLSLSRGAVLSLPVCALLLVALVPGRGRTIAALLVIGGAAATALPAVLDVGPAIVGEDRAAARAAADDVVRAIGLAALAAGAVVLAAAALERFAPPSPRTGRAIGRAWGSLVVVAAVAGAVIGLAALGSPVDRVSDAWDSFKGGYSDNASGGNRLTSGLGSNRYDFYRVALDQFRDHPVAGIGADNFFQDYLQHGRSDETPAYPHDLPLRTLAQTGLIGGLLLLGAVAAALAAAWRGMRVRRDPLTAAVAGGATLAFLYWVVHGATDWFWEWAGLGAPAFALLGLACALAPRRGQGEERAVAAADVPEAWEPGRRARRATGAGSASAGRAAAPTGAVAVADPPSAAAGARRRPVVLASACLAVVGALAGALAIAGPWLAEREMERAGAIFAEQPLAAYERLDRAAGLAPLSARPALLEGSIALRYGDVARAEAAFRDALRRDPRSQYAALELGALASARGRPREARRQLERATALAPRDALAREALAVVRDGDAVDVTELNRRILMAGQRLQGG